MKRPFHCFPVSRRETRTVVTALAVTALAVAALGGAGSAHAGPLAPTRLSQVVRLSLTSVTSPVKTPCTLAGQAGFALDKVFAPDGSPSSTLTIPSGRALAIDHLSYQGPSVDILLGIDGASEPSWAVPTSADRIFELPFVVVRPGQKLCVVSFPQANAVFASGFIAKDG